jgi:hypothetical protein
MKSTTAGQAGSRNNGPALTHFTRLWRTAFRTMAVPEMVYRVAARRVDSRSRRGFSIAAPHSWYLPIDTSAR